MEIGKNKEIDFEKNFLKNQDIEIRGKNSNLLKKNIMKIAQENLFMYKRLKDKSSFYDFNKFLKEYEQNQYYKKNACNFPCINFYKEKKNNCRNKDLYSFSLDEIKHKNSNNICKTDKDSFPKVTSNITTRHSTVNNTIEDCVSIKRKYHGKKKKFKNFTLNDLKNLKFKKNKSNIVFNLMNPIKYDDIYDNAKRNMNKDNIKRTYSNIDYNYIDNKYDEKLEKNINGTNNEDNVSNETKKLKIKKLIICDNDEIIKKD